MLRDNQRWQAKRERGWLRYSRFRLIPVREYGEQPESGDELVPAVALDKALAAMNAAVKAPSRRKADAVLGAALRDLES